MSINASIYTRVVVLTGLLVLAPLQLSSDRPAYDAAMANNSSDKANSKSQGQSRAAGKEGSAEKAASGSLGNRGRLNSLKASVKAVGRASSYMTQYSAALGAFATVDPTDDPTAEQLAAILAKVANRQDLTPENIDWIHQQLLRREMVTQSTLEDAASILAPHADHNADPSSMAPATPTLAELLSAQANAIQESESSRGLGPIY